MNQENPSDTLTRRLPELEGMRGVLALWVLAYHVLSISGWWQNLPNSVKAVADGTNAVDVFILLSGFVICGLLLSKREPYFVFLFRRYARLMPVFVICLIAALSAEAMGYMPVRYKSQDLPFLLAGNLTLLHGAIPEFWIKGASGAILNPAWSISLEWQFYLVAPFLVALLSRFGSRFIAGSLVCIAIYRLALPNLVGFSSAFLPYKIQLFWIGIVSALAYRWIASNEANRNLGQAVALAALAACVLLLPYKQNIGLLIWIVTMVMLTGRWQGIWHLLGSKTFVALGALSYPLYLAHEVIIWIVVSHWTPKSNNELLLLFAVVFVLAILSAWILHKIIEVPVNNFAKRVFN